MAKAWEEFWPEFERDIKREAPAPWGYRGAFLVCVKDALDACVEPYAPRNFKLVPDVANQHIKKAAVDCAGWAAIQYANSMDVWVRSRAVRVACYGLSLWTYACDTDRYMDRPDPSNKICG